MGRKERVERTLVEFPGPPKTMIAPVTLVSGQLVIKENDEIHCRPTSVSEAPGVSTTQYS